jgi:hypothetical protein
MSRLDDELKVAFRRKQPSIDFAARVLERINEPPAPKKNWRQVLARFFEPPKLRWVAIGVAASLLVAIATGGYRLLQQEPVEKSTPFASTIPAPETGVSGANKNEVVPAPVMPGKKPHRQIIKKREVAAGGVKNRANLAGLRKEPPVSPEAEAAKERVLFALQIVGSTLSDAQKVIQEDSPKSKPEPLHNR